MGRLGQYGSFRGLKMTLMEVVVDGPEPNGMGIDLGRVTFALHAARTGCDVRTKARPRKRG